MPSKKAPAKAAAKKPSKPAAAKEADLTPVDAQLAQYSDEDRVKIDALREAGIELTLNETSEELDDKLAAIEDDDDTGEAEEAELPRSIAPRFENRVVENKPRRLAIHFVYTKDGKSALYNEHGKRISPVYRPEDTLPDSTTNALKSIAKAAAKNNAIRRNSMLPEDFLPGAA